MEDVREAEGVRHSIGEPLTCPFCLDLWIATGVALGLVFSPRVTRIVLGTFSAVAGADCPSTERFSGLSGVLPSPSR